MTEHIKYKGRTFQRILELMEAGVALREVSRVLNVPYSTVLSIKQRFFDEVLVRKTRQPDPNQLSFFQNYWRKDR